jgi:hypothetical protein
LAAADGIGPAVAVARGPGDLTIFCGVQQGVAQGQQQLGNDAGIYLTRSCPDLVVR